MPTHGRAHTLSDSVSDLVCAVGAHHEEVEKTLNASNTSANVNLFSVTGSVDVTKLFAVVTDTTVFTNCTGAYFDVFSTPDSYVITKNDGVLSGMSVGTVFLKSDVATATMAIKNASTAGFTESSTERKAYREGIVTQKNGANTYIRFNYTTTDAPINAKIKFYVYYDPLDGGTVTVV